MKRVSKSSKKGFTLVELIVVLVILAILAAMLVPALTGYIRRARQEKEYQAASTVYTAVQALSTEWYGTGSNTNFTVAKVKDLTSIENIAGIEYTRDDDGQITKIAVSFSGGSNTGWYVFTPGGQSWGYQDADPGYTAMT